MWTRAPSTITTVRARSRHSGPTTTSATSWSLARRFATRFAVSGSSRRSGAGTRSADVPTGIPCVLSASGCGRRSRLSELGRALIGQLDDSDLAELAERLADHLGAGDDAPAAYTPATLAGELGRSERSIRAAIARGEIQAVKRGRGWVISAEAVAEWAQAPPGLRHVANPPRRRPPSGAGPARRGLARGSVVHTDRP